EKILFKKRRIKSMKFTSYLLLIFMCVFTLILSSCGGSTSVNPSPSPTPPPTGDLPLIDQNFKILTDEEILSGQAIPSAKFHFFADSLNSPITESSAFLLPYDNTSNKGAVAVLKIGSLLFSIYKSFSIKSDLKGINSEIKGLSNYIVDIDAKLSQLANQLELTQVNIQDYISSLNVQNYITPIKTAYSTTSSVGLIYYSNEAVLLEDNDPTAVPLATLQSQASVYVADVSAPNGIALQVQGIHDSICPDLAGLNGVLKDYTNKIILDPSQNGNNQNVQDPKNAMSTYLLLESFFTQLLNYQFQGLTILVNAYNYQDSTGNQSLAYINGTFKTLLKDEINKYLDTVNYMVANLVDYRTSDNYVHDMKYLKYGLAPDNVYLMVLARSRFFCSLITKALEDDFGLYGAMVLPYDYTGGADINLTFQGKGNIDLTVPVKAQKISGRFPYTKWDKGPNYYTASPDNQWLFYDMTPPGDLPAGDYGVQFNEGTSNPWPYEDNYLGTVSVKYYDPHNPNPNTATYTETETNTVKFGYFSLKWPWNSQEISSAPFYYWVLPAKIKYKKLDSIIVLNVDNPYLKNVKETDYTVTFPSANTPFNNQINMTMNKTGWSAWFDGPLTFEYEVQLLININPAPGDVSFDSAQMMYYVKGNVQANYPNTSLGTDYQTEYNLSLYDSTSETAYPFIAYRNTTHSINDSNTYQGITNFQLPNHTTGYSVHINAMYDTYDYPQYGNSFDLSLTWYLQIIYTNNYNIFQ
ncbi:MAG: hypothetical protein V2A78_07290, partial [bacterium]